MGEGDGERKTGDKWFGKTTLTVGLVYLRQAANKTYARPRVKLSRTKPLEGRKPPPRLPNPPEANSELLLRRNCKK